MNRSRAWRKKMNLKTRSMTTMLLGLVLGIAGMAVAQPDPGNAPKGANPPAWGQMDMGNWEKMTPAQRQEAMKKLVDQAMRDSLKRIGITDEKTVTTVLQFTEAQEKAKRSVREKARQVAVGITGNTLTEGQTAAALEELRQAVDDAKASQETDTATLEELTNFSKKPKLQALLTMLGLIGDETLFMQGVFGNTINAIGLLLEPPSAPEKLQQK